MSNKVSITIHPFIVRALTPRYDVVKLGNALDSAYNDKGKDKDGKEIGLTITDEDSGIKSARNQEKQEKFLATDQVVFKREGKLNDPRRFITWNTNFTKFVKTNGEPSEEITPAIIPANLRFWLEDKFLLP